MNSEALRSHDVERRYMAIFNHELAPVTHTGGFRKPARPASDAAEDGRPDLRQSVTQGIQVVWVKWKSRIGMQTAADV